MLPDVITLRPDSPYTLDMFSTLQERVDAARAILQGDTEPYLRWWDATCLPQKPPKGKRKIQERYVLEMAYKIRDEGYDEVAWAEWSKENHPYWYPIRVTIDPLGRVTLFDGNHRACFCFALGQPIHAQIYRRAPSWAAVVQERHKAGALYQPHSHPDLEGLKVYRRGVSRYETVGKYLADSGCERVCEIGSNYGVGCVAMAHQGLAVTGLEHNPGYARLQRSLFAVYPGLKLKSIQGGMGKRPAGVDAYVGLSVWHHLAQDLGTLDAWIRATSHAEFQIIELPEPGSTRWTDELLHDMKADYQTIGPKVLERIRALGGYKHKRTMGKDARYAQRETVALWK